MLPVIRELISLCFHAKIPIPKKNGKIMFINWLLGNKYASSNSWIEEKIDAAAITNKVPVSKSFIIHHSYPS